MDGVVLEFQGVTKRYRHGVVANDDVTFAVEDGDVFGAFNGWWSPARSESLQRSTIFVWSSRWSRSTTAATIASRLTSVPTVSVCQGSPHA